jgi:putative FmdB family regulatory protein
VGGFTGGDVDHPGAAQRIEVGQAAVGHEEGVYDLARALSDANAVRRPIDLAVSGNECQPVETTEDPVPTYEYACTACGHRLEAVQSFSDDPLTVCTECDGALRKVYGAVGIVLKGSGFYKTDSRAAANGNGSGKKSTADESSGSSGSSGEGAGTDAGSKTKTETPASSGNGSGKDAKPAPAAAG